MKQKIQNTVLRTMTLSVVMFGLLFFSTTTFAQVATPPPPTTVKNLPDIMLGKRAALEVIERALGEWGATMVKTDPNATDYTKVSSEFTLLYVTNNFIQMNKSLNVTTCVEEAGKIVWAEKLIADEVAYNQAMAAVKKLLYKNNYPNYKENY